MRNSGFADLYFIVAVMIFTLIFCGAAVFFFFRTFYREKRAAEAARHQRAAKKTETELQN
jgi:hypothetical protein